MRLMMCVAAHVLRVFFNEYAPVGFCFAGGMEWKNQ
jgi:hypothetical protein